MAIRTLGVDLGIRAAHVATLCDERGERVWSRRRFRNRHDELEALVGQIGECDELTRSRPAHHRLGGMMWLVRHAPVGRWNTG